MKTLPLSPRAATGGYALVFVLIIAGVSLLTLSTTLRWTATSSTLNQRNNQYFVTLAAAEAATEKVLTAVERDLQNGGESLVSVNLDNYRAMVPTIGESAYWAQFAFDNAQGTSNRNYVVRTTTNSAVYTPLQSQYQGLYGLAATYRIVSNARQINAPHQIAAAVKQDVQVASIPVFQFAIFYSIDLEINPGPNMTVTGRVHSNSNLYTQTGGGTLTFQSDVNSAGQIIPGKSPLDPLVRTPGPVIFQAEHDSGVSSLTLPVGTNNSPAAVHSVLEVPPVGEDPNSLVGKQRYYNKADLVITVTDGGTTAKSGLFNNFGTAIPAGEVNTFVNTGVTFYNKREGKTVKTTEIDVAKLKTWSETNSSLRTPLGRDVRAIYVVDQRSQSGSTESGVRVVNGQTLPSLGLTVATPNPIYVKGHYNAPAGVLGTTNTAGTKPASLVGDAISILSSSWNDANSSLSLGNRDAGNTTVNAALLAGIVPSNGTYYSGGVENFPRFLENWSGNTLAYNGSMVVMFQSQIATAPWGGSDVYSPPTRQWTFDLNFMDATKLPPGTPEVRAVVRGEWASIKPGTVY